MFSWFICLFSCWHLDADHLRELKRIEKALEESGMLAREGGKLNLTV